LVILQNKKKAVRSIYTLVSNAGLILPDKVTCVQ
jgi:hypothetical protein